MADEQRNAALTSIFGADATRAIIGLMRAGPEAFAAMETSISQQGAAADLAGARMKGLGGAWEGFKSTLETTQLSVMEPFLGPLEGWVRGAADALAAATPALTAFVTEGVIPGATAFAGLLSDFIAAPDKLAFLGDQFGLLAKAAGKWALDAIPDLLLNLLELRNRAVAWVIEQAPGWGTALATEWGPKLWQWVSTDGAKLLTEFAGKQLDLLKIIGGAVPSFDLEFGKWGASALGWLPTYEEFKVGADAFVDGIWPWIKEKVPIFGENLGSWSTAFVEWIGPAFGRLIVAAGGAFGDFLGWITKDETAKDIISSLNSWTLAFLVWSYTDLPAALLSSLGGLGKTVWDELVKLWGAAFAEGSLGKSLVDGLIKGMGDAWGTLTQWFSENWTKLLGAIPGMAPIMAAVNGASLAGVPGFASGVRNFGGGLALVGERGPELLNLPGGSDVIPSGATRGLLSGGGTSISVGQIVITGSNDPAATARAVREELIKMGKRNLNIFGGYA